jgi:hypothetical protein
LKCEFSLTHYKECIQLAADKGYIITPIRKYTETNVKQIILRHDVDWSLEFAYELANFEYDLGVCSTYHIRLHSENYNALAPKSMKMIEAMSGMGHEIGLHYDSDSSMSYEVNLLSSIARKPVYSYSQHLPWLTKKEEYQGLTDAMTLDLKYISDSGRHWREGCMCNHIGKHSLQILTHPLWWVTNPKSREDGLHQLFMQMQFKITRDITEIKQLLYNYYRDDLKLGGENVQFVPGVKM